MSFIDKAKNAAGDALNKAKDAASNIDKDAINEQVDKLQERIGNEKINEQIDNLQERMGGNEPERPTENPAEARDEDPENPAQPAQ